MKILFFLFLFTIFFACSDSSGKIEALQTRLDKLEKKLDDSYKPGFGEFMSNIQVHHAKLWFAGINNNWKLADFEIHEIKETLEDLEKYQAERTEIKSLSIIYPALGSVNAAIDKQDLKRFKTNFTILTKTCNRCHQAVNYPFNDVKIPDSPPFSNQIFKKQNTQ